MHLQVTRGVREAIRRAPGRASAILLAACGLGVVLAGPSRGSAAESGKATVVQGTVLGSRSPVAGSTVSLWAASAGPPRRLAQARTGDDGTFRMSVAGGPSGEDTLYFLAEGGQPAADPARRSNGAISLMAVVGSHLPARVALDELTTVASVWTHAQLLDEKSIRGPALSRRIAAGNVPHFVDVQTGGYGDTIQDALNSTETPTMANFATLSDVLAGCVAQVKDDACGRLFAAATPRGGPAPADTLAAAQAIARDPSYEPARVFALLDAFYPVPGGKHIRPAPFLPYLSFAPSAWTLPLKFSSSPAAASRRRES
jgi:hypothetical protein